MELPEYVSKEEVQRVCRALGIRDWTELEGSEITREEAGCIQDLVGAEAAEIPLEAFLQGLEVELEHGLMFPDANVTNNHPILTGKIVLAHLKETLDYYQRLEVAELEGDLIKAAGRGDSEALKRKFQQLVAARANLRSQEEARLAEI